MLGALMAQEAIQFQSRSILGETIEIALTTLRGHDHVGDRLMRATKLAKLIGDECGLTVDFKIDTNPYVMDRAAILVPDVDRNHPVLDEWNRMFATGESGYLLLDGKKLIKGGVDLVKARVSGDFTQFKATIFLSQDLLIKSSNYTVKEVAAIILHELGHFFSYLELLGRLSSTNYVLQEATKALLGASDKTRKYEIMDAVEAFTELKISDRDALADATSKEGCTVLLLNDHIDSCRSEMGSSIYDSRGFEQLSDQFVSRMGYGVPLASALDKIFRKYRPNTYMSSAANFITSAIGLAVVVLVTNVFFPALVGFLLLATNPLYDEYDKPKKRLEVIRQEAVKSLKTPYFTAKDKARVLQDIDTLDKIIEKMNDYGHWFTWLYTNLIPTGRRQKRSIELQQSLERLANTRLIESTARLEQLLDQTA